MSQHVERRNGRAAGFLDVGLGLRFDSLLDVLAAAFLGARDRLRGAVLLRDLLDAPLVAVLDLQRIELARDARICDQHAAPLGRRLDRRRQRADTVEQLLTIVRHPVLPQAAVDVHAAEVCRTELLVHELRCAVLDPRDDGRRQVLRIEDQQEHAPSGLIGRPRQDDGRRQIARRHRCFGDEVEVLNRLRLALLEHFEVVRGQAGHEPAVLVLHDDVDFDQARGRSEHAGRRFLRPRLPRGGAGHCRDEKSGGGGAAVHCAPSLASAAFAAGVVRLELGETLVGLDRASLVVHPLVQCADLQIGRGQHRHEREQIPIRGDGAAQVAGSGERRRGVDAALNLLRIDARERPGRRRRRCL